MSNGRGSDRGDRGGRGRFPLNPPNQGSNGPPQQHQGIKSSFWPHYSIYINSSYFSGTEPSASACC